jgi:PII-like signaling protein
MELKGEAALLRIFLGEMDKVEHTPMYDEIVMRARKSGLSGATVWRGIMGFGPTARMRTSKILDLSSDLPIFVEIVDTREKLEPFLEMLHDLFESVQCGALITIEKVEVIRYLHGKGSRG